MKHDVRLRQRATVYRVTALDMVQCVVNRLPGLATQRERDLTATCHRKEALSNQRGCCTKERGPQRPQCAKERGTQGPWRRRATGWCRLSRQLLACGGRLAREDRPPHLPRPVVTV